MPGGLAAGGGEGGRGEGERSQVQEGGGDRDGTGQVCQVGGGGGEDVTHLSLNCTNYSVNSVLSDYLPVRLVCSWRGWERESCTFCSSLLVMHGLHGGGEGGSKCTIDSNMSFIQLIEHVIGIAVLV